MSGLTSILAEPRLSRVLAVLDGAGEETRIVGGAVRNALMGLPVAEVDLATTARPEETVRRAEAAGLKAVPTGISHGTVTVVCEGVPFEVTTLREDVETDGRHAVVRFGRDWSRDAERRDFTMNALFATRDGKVIDLVGGRADLEARRVRFIGVPEQRIREDYLRILRLFRFHAAYGEGPIDEAAFLAAVRCREGLRTLSRERIGAELMKLLSARRAPETVALMDGAGLLGTLLGGVGYPVALFRLAAVEAEAGLSPDPLLRLAVLAVRIREDADRLLERLRLSRATHRRLVALADQGRFFSDRDAIYRLGVARFMDWLLFNAAIAAPAPDPAELAARIAFARAWVQPSCPIQADRLMALGVPAGPDLGAAVGRAREAWIKAGFPTDEQEIAAIVARAVAEIPSLQET